jgi:flavin reductase (DIM6/NTAB) family NADH-FMN oxidoreductase RutF
MSYAQRLQQGPPRELQRKDALFSIGIPWTDISPIQFPEALSRAAIAVTIVATDGPGGRAGVTYSAVSTVCNTPPPIRFCVNRGSAANSVITAIAGLSVNRLTAGRSDISPLFFRHRSNVNERTRREQPLAALFHRHAIFHRARRQSG